MVWLWPLTSTQSRVKRDKCTAPQIFFPGQKFHLSCYHLGHVHCPCKYWTAAAAPLPPPNSVKGAFSSSHSSVRKMLWRSTQDGVLNLWTMQFRAGVHLDMSEYRFILRLDVQYVSHVLCAPVFNLHEKILLLPFYSQSVEVFDKLHLLSEIVG